MNHAVTFDKKKHDFSSWFVVVPTSSCRERDRLRSALFQPTTSPCTPQNTKTTTGLRTPTSPDRDFVEQQDKVHVETPSRMSPRERLDELPKDGLLDVTETPIEGPKKTVAFGEVRIREYNRIVGDHPDVAIGPPLSFGWEYTERPSVAINTYEADRPIRSTALRLTGATRKQLLITTFGIPEEEVRSAEKEVQRIRSQQAKTKDETSAAKKVRSKLWKRRRNISKNILHSLAAAAKYMAPPMMV